VVWTPIFSTTTGDGGIDSISFAPVSARYVRMYGTTRGTTYGYSLWEFEVYGDSGSGLAAVPFQVPENNRAIILVPGSSTGTFYAKFNLDKKQDVRLNIYTISGRNLCGLGWTGVKNETKIITLGPLLPGVYFYTADIAGANIVKKLVVK
jgi:hypothetical protein